MSRKWTQVGLLAATILLAMTVWFSASAVVPQLTAEWKLSGGESSWLTMSVQIGFVLGALLSALLNLADRVPAHRLVAGSALLAAAANAAIPLLGVGLAPALALRFLTGIALAGVYPPGMKLVASWCREDRGFGIGILVGALTLGSGVPHLLNALPVFGTGGMPPWRSVLLATSAQSAIAGLLAAAFIHPGPYLGKAPPFDWRYAGRVLADRPTRLANFGYLGHMWELYAMWTWIPAFATASFAARYSAEGSSGSLVAFAGIASGAVGCVAAGLGGDTFGKARIARLALVTSSACAATSWLFFGAPTPVLLLFVIVWGFSVVADSAQFSALVSEYSPRTQVGTALTLQTSMGFLLTIASIRLLPWVASLVGWRWTFLVLVPGPVLGAAAMSALMNREQSRSNPPRSLAR